LKIYYFYVSTFLTTGGSPGFGRSAARTGVREEMTEREKAHGREV
jgi:hypothetical protein